MVIDRLIDVTNVSFNITNEVTIQTRGMFTTLLHN